MFWTELFWSYTQRGVSINDRPEIAVEHQGSVCGQPVCIEAIKYFVTQKVTYP